MRLDKTLLTLTAFKDSLKIKKLQTDELKEMTQQHGHQVLQISPLYTFSFGIYVRARVYRTQVRHVETLLPQINSVAITNK